MSEVWLLSYVNVLCVICQHAFHGCIHLSFGHRIITAVRHVVFELRLASPLIDTYEDD